MSAEEPKDKEKKIKIKDSVADERRRLLSKRKDKPHFRRYLSYKIEKLGTSWRRPRGLHNKMRGHIVSKGMRVQSGYGRDRKLRGLHPSGFVEKRVFNLADMNSVAKGEAVRIASSVGMKKRLEIEEKAAGMNIKVLNPARRG